MFPDAQRSSMKIMRPLTCVLALAVAAAARTTGARARAQPRHYFTARDDHSPAVRLAGAGSTNFSTTPPLPPAEQHALDVFFVDLGGEDWVDNFGWDSGSNPCDVPGWFGVTCDVQGNESHVTWLVLSHNNLRGVLPSLQDLASLTVLDLSSPEYGSATNAVRGTLDSICGLPTLETVRLAFNQFTGELPACLSGLVSVTVFNVGYNSIEGTTPDAVCGMVGLMELIVRSNRLQGTIPPCIGGLKALQTIDFSSVYSYDENEYYQYHVGPQSLEGVLPASLCNLPQLKHLMFQFTQGLSGSVPDCLGVGQPDLEWVLLQQNHLSGSFPMSLCTAGMLSTVHLYANLLTGLLPTCLGSLHQLRDFSIDLNNFRGPIPDSLCFLERLVFFVVSHNYLSGTIPACIGNLTKLHDYEIGNNLMTGTIPSTICGWNELIFLYLYDNQFHGRIPSCFGTAFPHLQAMLLHDNKLGGTIPEDWRLPSLISLVLSNNAGMQGTLPGSLFHQQRHHGNTSGAEGSTVHPNLRLRTVVIEGTSLHGTIPPALCKARQLETLALSGNFLSGSLPDCLPTLRELKTMRLATNNLVGTLPEALANLTSLAVLDLSFNLISGRVPAALGHMSPQFTELSLDTNHLSCDLPDSVRHWKRDSNATSTSDAFRFHLLKGNLFGCGGGQDSLFMKDASGLKHANPAEFESYSCGGSSYVLSLFGASVIVAPVLLAMAVLWCRGSLQLGWRDGLARRVDHSMRVEELFEAGRELTALGLGIAGGSLLAAAAMLAVVSTVAESPFECQYATALTLANKDGGNVKMSVGVGFSVGLGVALCYCVWWQRLFGYQLSASGSSSVQSSDIRGLLAIPSRHGVSVATSEDGSYLTGYFGSRLYSGERGAETGGERGSTGEPPSFAGRLARGAGIMLGLFVLTVIPNAVYVATVLSDLPQEEKLAAVVGLALVKTAVSTLVVPHLARLASVALMPRRKLAYGRFRLRLTLSTAIFALTAVAAPIAIVLITDTQCLRGAWQGSAQVTTEVVVEFCLVYTTTKTNHTCAVFAEDVVESSYTPAFLYDGSRCVSAVLSAYTPVFLGSVLLTAALPAAFELLVVPLVAPWLHVNGYKRTLVVIRALSCNVSPTLAKAAAAAAGRAGGAANSPDGRTLSFTARPFPPVPAADVDRLAALVVERGMAQLLGTLLVALTFGLAAPLVGGACAVAATVQLAHNMHTLGLVVGLALDGNRARDPCGAPNLLGCSAVPKSCAVVVLLAVGLVWACAAVGFLVPAALGSAAAATVALACAALALAVAGRGLRRGEAQSRGFEIASSAGMPTSRGLAQAGTEPRTTNLDDDDLSAPLKSTEGAWH